MRITLSAPIVTRSVQTGACVVKITVRRPILAPSIRKYSVYSGVPTTIRASGLATIIVLTSQNRK